MVKQVRRATVFVAGSRSFPDREAVAVQMRTVWKQLRAMYGVHGFELQFVVPVEDRFGKGEVPMAGAAALCVDVVAEGARRVRPGDAAPDTILPCMGLEIPWNDLEGHDVEIDNHGINTGRRKYPMSTFAQSVFEENGEIKLALLFEDGTDDWVRELQDSARNAGVKVLHFRYQDAVAGQAALRAPRTEAVAV